MLVNGEFFVGAVLIIMLFCMWQHLLVATYHVFGGKVLKNCGIFVRLKTFTYLINIRRKVLIIITLTYSNYFNNRVIQVNNTICLPRNSLYSDMSVNYFVCKVKTFPSQLKPTLIALRFNRSKQFSTKIVICKPNRQTPNFNSPRFDVN